MSANWTIAMGRISLFWRNLHLELRIRKSEGCNKWASGGELLNLDGGVNEGHIRHVHILFGMERNILKGF